MINEDHIPFIAMDIRIWRAFAIIFPRPETKWRVYAILLPIGFINALQFCYVYNMTGDLLQFTLNFFFASAIFTGIFRCFVILINRKKFELLLTKIAEMYSEIKGSNDRLANFILVKTIKWTRLFALCNLCLGALNGFGTIIHPILIEKQVHPMGVAIPMINVTLSPMYEVFYILELPLLAIVAVLYISYMTVFVGIALFGKALLLILNFKISQIEPKASANDIIPCIRYYGRIRTLVALFNEVVTYIAGMEYLVFSANIGLLLFCLIGASSYSQIATLCCYTMAMLYMPLVGYWHGNELVVENENLSQAVYNMPWYTFDIKLRKTVLIFLMGTQRPLMVRVGNVYPMTLLTFQSILNVAYQYFTLLRSVSKKRN